MANSGEQRDRARKLRRQSSAAARTLWSRLRNRRLGAKFRRDHPIGPYFADFCCIERHLIVEVDGSHHPDQQDYDEQRTGYLEDAGFRVIRFWTTELVENPDAVIDRVAAELSKPNDPERRLP